MAKEPQAETKAAPAAKAAIEDIGKALGETDRLRIRDIKSKARMLKEAATGFDFLCAQETDPAMAKAIDRRADDAIAQIEKAALAAYRLRARAA